ncbi:MAG: hypothetical protein ACETV0_07110 [Nitrososphaeria archaeon]
MRSASLIPDHAHGLSEEARRGYGEIAGSLRQKSMLATHALVLGTCLIWRVHWRALWEIQRLSEEIRYDEFCDRLRAELGTIRGVSSGDFSSWEPFFDRPPRSSPNRMPSSSIIAPKTGLQSGTDFYGIIDKYLR